MKWMDISELDEIKALSASSYANPKDTYPVALKPDSRMFELFMVPESVKGHEWRKTLGVYDEDGNLVMAAGIRRMQHQPVWLLSYVLSTQKNIGMVRAFRSMIMFLCDYHENIGINEFAVASPSTREEGYRKIMRFLRERYITWVECTIPAGTRSPWPVYHSMIGYAIHDYDINLRRYVKRRDKMDPDE
jgi:hypothetical protein